MPQFNKKTIFFIALPLVLFGLLLFARSRKPRLLPGVGGSVTAIAFSPDSQNVVCASNNNYVQIWLPEKEKWRSFYNPQTYSSGQPSLRSRLRFTSDGKTLFVGGAATGGSSDYSQAWDVATRRRKFAFNPTSNPVFDVSLDGLMAAMCQKNVAYIIDLQAKPVTISQEKYRHPEDARFIMPRSKIKVAGQVTCVAFSPNGKTLVVGDAAQGEITFWDVKTSKRIDVKTFVTTGATATFAEWSPDGKVIAVAVDSGLTIYDTVSQRTFVADFPTANSLTNQNLAYMGGVVPIAWAPDGKTIFTGGDEVRRWRASDLKLEYSYGVSGPVAVSPDGRTLATASRADDSIAPKGVLLWKLGW